MLYFFFWAIGGFKADIFTAMVQARVVLIVTTILRTRSLRIEYQSLYVKYRHHFWIEEIGSSVGRAHNLDAGYWRFESHEIQPGDFSTDIQMDMPDIECRIMSSVSPTYSFSRWEKWTMVGFVPRMRTLNGGPDGRRVTSCLVLWTLFEKSSVKTRCSFTSCPVFTGQVHGAVRGAWTWVIDRLVKWVSGRLDIILQWSSFGTLNLTILYYQNMYKRFYDANEIDHINFRWLQLLILTLYS